MSLKIAPSDRPEPHILAALYRAADQPEKLERFIDLACSRRAGEAKTMRITQAIPYDVLQGSWAQSHDIDPIVWALEYWVFCSKREIISQTHDKYDAHLDVSYAVLIPTTEAPKRKGTRIES